MKAATKCKIVRKIEKRQRKYKSMLKSDCVEVNDSKLPTKVCIDFSVVICSFKVTFSFLRLDTYKSGIAELKPSHHLYFNWIKISIVLIVWFSFMVSLIVLSLCKIITTLKFICTVKLMLREGERGHRFVRDCLKNIFDYYLSILCMNI